jgi:hypothetical protein
MRKLRPFITENSVPVVSELMLVLELLQLLFEITNFGLFYGIVKQLVFLLD